MFARYFTMLGWAWVACLAIVGFIVLVGAQLEGTPTGWFSPGEGVALQLIAAGILFAAVFPTLAKDLTSLVGIAGMLTAVFGYAGTMLVLYDANPVLLVLVLLLTVYPMSMASLLLSFAVLMREAFGIFQQ